ncbi:MAG: hypothetical protein M1840_003480 [Geoglossum simile]|nr:MAG: hypothetical protein M1840_003480 [Geoglossum simile]
MFILVSFAVLPVEKTHRHYLSVSLTVGIIFMEVAFIIPLVSKPQQCINLITPYDMRSSISCALSVFLRALSLHLQICWQIVAGQKFFIGAQLFGWGLPALFLGLVLGITGVSFRFGDTCQINHTKGLQVFWGPMLGFAAAAIIIQFSTFGYCIRVYISSLLDNESTTSSSVLPSYSGSIRTLSARQAYKRIQRVVALQWRGMLIVILILADVIFFSIVFLRFDESTGVAGKNFDKAKPWLTCLTLTGGDKKRCLPLAEKLVVNEATVIAVLILLSMNGIWCMIFFARWGMVTGWIELFKNKLRRRPKEFVSVDACQFSRAPCTYEMLSSGVKSPESVVTSSPVESATERVYPSQGSEAPYPLGCEVKYAPPALSFSLPCSPVYQGREWGLNSSPVRGTMSPDTRRSK